MRKPCFFCLHKNGIVICYYVNLRNDYFLYEKLGKMSCHVRAMIEMNANFVDRL